MRTQTPDGLFFVCPNCQGRAVGLSIVRKLKRHGELKELWERVIQGEGSRGVGCPICRKAMVEVPVPVGPQQVRLDVCRSCQFIWFDPEELEQLPHRPQQQNDQVRLPEKVREQMAMADLAVAAQKQRMEDLSPLGAGGELAPDEPWQWIPGVLGLPVECEGNPVGIFPWLTWGLAAVLVGVFALTYQNLANVIQDYGMIPATAWQVGLVTSFSAFLLHAGLLHLIGNVYFLVVFGDNVEDRLGPFRYLTFYLLCGFASGLSHLLLNQSSNVPTIGASGAIAGVMGAYFILYPNSKILTLIPIFFIPYFIEISAFFFLAFWFFLQFISAAGSSAESGGIAWWAHIGGFIFGIAFLKIFLAIPASGTPSRLRRATAKKKTPRLQVIRPVGPGNDPHLYGTILIAPHEAAAGTQKLINIPWGFHKRLFKVVVPAGTSEGNILRLKGMGKQRNDRPGQGDLFLKVVIRS